MLESAVKFCQCRCVTVKLALYCGSSKFGKALRASVGWNLVVDSQLQQMNKYRHCQDKEV